MGPSQYEAMMRTSTARTGSRINMEELQQRLSKLRSLSGTPPLTFQQSDSGSQSKPLEVGGKRSCTAHRHEPVDSGYGTAAPSPDTQKAEFVGQDLPGTKLKCFHQHIPDHLNKRFFDIKVLCTQPLLDAIARKRRSAGDIGMKLKYLGLTGQSTEPYIVIQCNKKTAKIVKKFFAQPHIEEELRPDFRVHVLDEELMRLADDDVVQVFANATPNNTWCGAPIVMSSQLGCIASATLGGMVMVEDITGKKTLYGLTASHPLSKLKTTGLPSPDVSDSESDMSETESEATVEGSDLPIDSLEPSESHGGSDEEVAVSGSELIGSIVHHNLDAPADGNFDWALVGLADVKLLPNLIVVKAGSPPSPENSESLGSLRTQVNIQDDFQAVHLTWNKSNAHCGFISKPVSVISRHGPQAGTLTFNTSSVLIAPGQKFVETHDLSMRPTMRLQPGDSGSWVVDESSGDAFGYVVSVDAFGEAQVMPFELVLADIAVKLQAMRVWLPSPDDINLSPIHLSQHTSVFDFEEEPRDFLRNSKAEPWMTGRALMPPPPRPNRSHSVGSRPSELQDARQRAMERLRDRLSRWSPVPDPSWGSPESQYYDIEFSSAHQHNCSSRSIPVQGPPRGKNETDSGYASRASSHQTSPFQSPP